MITIHWTLAYSIIKIQNNIPQEQMGPIQTSLSIFKEQNILPMFINCHIVWQLCFTNEDWNKVAYLLHQGSQQYFVLVQNKVIFCRLFCAVLLPVNNRNSRRQFFVLHERPISIKFVSIFHQCWLFAVLICILWLCFVTQDLESWGKNNRFIAWELQSQSTI